MTATTRTPLCTVDWCLRPTDSDYHVCIVCSAPAVQHAHVESRALNPSRRKDKANQVMLCVPHHQEVDLRQNGVHGHAIRQIPGMGRLYFRFDLHGNTTFQKVLDSTSAGDESVTPPGELTGALPVLVGAGGESGSSTVSPDSSPAFSMDGEGDAVLTAVADSSPFSHMDAEGESEGASSEVLLPEIATPTEKPSPRPPSAFSLTSGCQEGMQILYWGLKLKDATDEWRWRIGDWLVRMEQELGEPAYQYFEPLKEAFGYDAIRQYKSVAERVTPVTRVTALA